MKLLSSDTDELVRATPPWMRVMSAVTPHSPHSFMLTIMHRDIHESNAYVTLSRDTSFSRLCRERRETTRVCRKFGQ